jgi:hypothetical protein
MRRVSRISPLGRLFKLFSSFRHSGARRWPSRLRRLCLGAVKRHDGFCENTSVSSVSLRMLSTVVIHESMGGSGDGPVVVHPTTIYQCIIMYLWRTHRDRVLKWLKHVQNQNKVRGRVSIEHLFRRTSGVGAKSRCPVASPAPSLENKERLVCRLLFWKKSPVWSVGVQRGSPPTTPFKN